MVKKLTDYTRRRLGPHLRGLYLFGSVTRGAADPGDIDVLVVVDKVVPTMRRWPTSLYYQGRRLPLDITIVDFSEPGEDLMHFFNPNREEDRIFSYQDYQQILREAKPLERDE